MYRIQQYHNLCAVKPMYFSLRIPFDKPSPKKNKLMIREMDVNPSQDRQELRP
jgi:hypothetical protein